MNKMEMVFSKSKVKSHKLPKKTKDKKRLIQLSLKLLMEIFQGIQ